MSKIRLPWYQRRLSDATMNGVRIGIHLGFLSSGADEKAYDEFVQRHPDMATRVDQREQDADERPNLRVVGGPA